MLLNAAMLSVETKMGILGLNESGYLRLVAEFTQVLEFHCY